MSQTDLFIADLHLQAGAPQTLDAFAAFMTGPARAADRLFVLGDLFEYWAGDDDMDAPVPARVGALLADAAAHGPEIVFLAGNRDFFIGEAFAARAGFAIAVEPLSVRLGDRETVLLHGDSLCTDDHAYQAFRAQVRNPAFQADFLAKPLAVRKAMIEGARTQSEAGKREKSQEIMDVNAGAVEEAFRAAGCRLMIHGHTHRPATHLHVVDGQDCERWVLADWHGTAPYLEAVDGRITRRELIPT